MLDIRSVITVYHLNIRVFILCKYASRRLVEAVFYQFDTSGQIYGERIGSPWK